MYTDGRIMPCTALPPFPITPAARFALDRLGAAGYEAFLVGGCVRDFLRGAEPHDLDMTTNATPDEMHRVFADCRLIDTGIRHGTVTLLYAGEPLEITTYRVDGGYADSRHPTAVSFTASLREDAARRDFTVNAMAYHPEKGLYDFFGGYADLCAGCIRAVGEPERRFAEDALRVLRALRFSAELGYRIEAETARALTLAAPGLLRISAERVREELVKLLCGAHAGEVLCTYSSVFAIIAPAWQIAVEGDKATRVSRIARTLGLLPADPVPRLTAFLLPLVMASGGIDRADTLLSDLRFDRRTRERAVKLLAHFSDDCTGDTATLRRFVAGVGPVDAPLLIALHQAWESAGEAPDPDRLAALRAAALAVGELVAADPVCSIADLALRGEDLLSLGFSAGRALGDALRALLAAVLDGRVENEKAALLACAQELLQE